MATNRDAFTKAREVKRLESIDIQDDEDESEATDRSTTTENLQWDKVQKQWGQNSFYFISQYFIIYDKISVNMFKASDKMVAGEIGISISAFKRMKSAIGYSNTQLVDGHKQFQVS